MRTMNMWQRLGVVLSILWIIGGGIWARFWDVNRASEQMSLTYKVCTDGLASTASPAAYSGCMNDAEHSFDVFMAGSWGNVAFFAIVPVLLGWIVTYVVIRVTRWVMAGRHI